MASAQLTWVKTPKGIEEVESKVHGLALKSRQVLIMIDGKRDLGALQGIFPPEMVPGIIDELKAGGFIREFEKPKPAAAALPPEEDAFVLGQTFMINIAKKTLGIAGDGVIAKLKQADDVDGLRGLFTEWRNAIKQNPDGLMRLKEYENKLSQVLGELSAPAAAATAAPKPPTNDAERLDLARTFMSNTARTFLGIAANGLIAKVETTRSIADLRHLFFEWRESLKQSPDAKRRLAELESKLAALLS